MNQLAALIARRGVPLPPPRDGLVVLVHFRQWSYPCVIFSQTRKHPTGPQWLWYVPGAENHPAARDRRGRPLRPRAQDCLHDAQDAFLFHEDLVGNPRTEVVWWAPVPTRELALPYQAERDDWSDIAASLPLPVLSGDAAEVG